MEADLARIEAEVVEWGLAERGPQGLAWTRRMRAAVARASAALQALESQGRAPAGHPLLVAVRQALQEGPAGPNATERHAMFLFAVELHSLPPAVQEFLAKGG